MSPITRRALQALPLLLAWAALSMFVIIGVHNSGLTLLMIVLNLPISFGFTAWIFR